MFRGMCFVLIASFFWGLIFVVPLFIEGFTPLEVALGRYFFFGVVSLIIMACRGWNTWRKIPFKIWRAALGYSVIANVAYYTFLVVGLHHSSAAVTALISGCAPITIACCSNWREGWSGLRSLIFPSLCMFFGLILVNLDILQDEEISNYSIQYILGLLCAFAALAIWTWYVLANAKFLEKSSDLPPGEWTTLTGVATWIWVLILGSVVGAIDERLVNLNKYISFSDELLLFVSGTLILAVGASWLGFYFWNRATASLPLALAGQLTIFETLFGLSFVFLFEQRMPSLMEVSGISLLFGGVFLASLHSYRKQRLRDDLKSL